MDLTNIWFQLEGATCHTVRETFNLLYEKFEGSVISRGGDVKWPPPPLDFFVQLREICPNNDCHSKGQHHSRHC